jgi:hypothetical protein
VRRDVRLVAFFRPVLRPVLRLPVERIADGLDVFVVFIRPPQLGHFTRPFRAVFRPSPTFLCRRQDSSYLRMPREYSYILTAILLRASELRFRQFPHGRRDPLQIFRVAYRLDDDFDLGDLWPSLSLFTSLLWLATETNLTV